MPARKPDNLNVLKMRNYCLRCEERSKCRSLCNIVKKYVDQDNCKREEMLLREPTIWTSIGFITGINTSSPEELKKLIIELYLDGKNAYDIGNHIHYSRQHIDRIIQEYKKLCKGKP